MKAAIAIGLCASLSGVSLYFAVDDQKTTPPNPTSPAKRGRNEKATVKPTSPLVDAPPVQKTKVSGDDIESALDRATFADFSETPLSQALLFLGTQHNILVYVDQVGLANAMVDRDQAVTYQMSSVRLGLLLDFMLEPMNLDYAVRENVLFISSKERVAQLRETAVVRIGDIVPQGAAARESADRIVTTIISQIDNDAWNVNGGMSNIEYIPDARSLVVTAPSRTQRKINKLLEELRSAKVADGMPAKGGTSRIAAR